jgi:hypothetical protein
MSESFECNKLIIDTRFPMWLVGRYTAARVLSISTAKRSKYKSDSYKINNIRLHLRYSNNIADSHFSEGFPVFRRITQLIQLFDQICFLYQWKLNYILSTWLYLVKWFYIFRRLSQKNISNPMLKDKKYNKRYNSSKD